ncbi:virulence plasmid 28 protein [Photorhabdus khanii NC19]|uniref:Virulence plasmid 28 protein n=1 Tax=Photorhabdus khanii NC19 TaxID=1004151 RepID=W3V1S7_9GAMM|nr:neuraminidase-like domain-containing protein [Photorhabdus khanii]ETS29768.1 virulence plasmid 28 protein [Photorhabdus khanii NC19]
MSTLTPERPEITQQEQKANRLHEASILKRANPQLQNAVHLAITEPHADQQGYNSKFGGRANQYVAPGAVSSMFSPAAYLTELYRQARGLHADNSDYHLDKRRPDLKLLTLSQQNMDDEVSTLSLSNKVLLEGIKTLTGLEGHTNVMKTLSTFRTSGSMPYHDAYENVRKIIQLQAPVFEQFNESPKIADLMYQTSLLGINAFISPELFNILVEKITDDEEEIKRLYGKNFGDIEPALMATPEKLKSYYNLTDEELNQFIDQQKIRLIHEEMNSEYPNQQPAQYYLLMLNKIIRLSQATGLTPTILKSIISSSTYQEVSIYPEVILEAVITVYNELNDGPDIDAKILKKISRVKCYMQRYGIDAETALILCNVPISGNIYSGSPSQLFNRLFNTPPLDGQNFSTSDREEIDLNLGSTNDWRKAVLKRAFNVDDDSLKRLFKITNRSNTNGKIIHSVENLSYLYLAKLLADIHQLTIDELDLLLVAIDEGTTHLSGINDENLAALIDKLYAVTRWLRARKWGMYQLLVMTTTDYNKTLTPEIQNLLDTVYNGLQGFNSENEANLLLKMSPYIAAALQLPSENVAHYVLTWADQLKPSAGKVTAGKFLGWLQALRDPKQPKSTVTQEQAVQYCQCLAQLALIYRSTGLSENTLRLFVTKPQRFGFTEITASTHNALSLIRLTRFTDWVNSLGERASSVLTEFEKETLEAKQLADAMNLDKNLLGQASAQAQVNFSNWISLDTILQWVHTAHQLNISPQGVFTLAQVMTAESPPDYTQWENVAAILTAGLDTQQTNTLHAFLDESRSAALSEYYIGKVASQNSAIKNRDDLYQYLLIDNQVSSAIKTTPIAEAIASIQLYVNRALKKMEGDAVTSVICHPFFINWDKYNKRYSTWASVSKLVYYPENYIDPTMRIGQTKMMDTLLQSISQSQLNTDTVEDAFMSYLTSFEQVANLEVVSAYHDNANSDQGLTYFIGHSKTEVNQYYWRNVDHNKFSDGKFPANAWSEWYKIDCPINPYKNTIRPVIFQSRLYLIWLEQRKAVKQIENNNQTVEEDYHLELKLAHIRYDGTWNTPITFDVSDKILTVFKILTPLEQSNALALLEQLKKYQKQLEEKLEEQKKFEEQLKSLKPLNPISPPVLLRPQESSESLEALLKQRKEQLAQWEKQLLQQEKQTTEINILEKQMELNQQEIQKQQNLLEQQLGFYCTNHQHNKLLVMFYQKQDDRDKYTTDAPIIGLHISSNMLSEDMNLEDYLTHIHKQFDTYTKANSAIRMNNRYEVSSSAETDDDNILALHHDTNGAQYMQWGTYRIRLNTLFARKLISRANTGLDTILSIETQNIQEPQLGQGFYATFIMPPYNPSTHGERWFKLQVRYPAGNPYTIYSGQLEDTSVSITLFIPMITFPYAPPNPDYHARVNIIFKKVQQDSDNYRLGPLFIKDHQNKISIKLNSNLEHFQNVNVLKDSNREPMDFSGANSLYFWELFYYVPMLIAQRLLHEQNFDEANRWLKYIWNPSGYIKHGQIQHYNWNVRPLLEDTRWNDDPLNSVDPDAVAQYDPMHYKVVTFMRTLDLLLDRGDYAYRQLERDTLNEAKMWYMQALHLLGDKPDLSFSSEWSKQSLGDAARTEKQEEHAQAITSLRQGDVSRHKNPTDLFLPQVNEVMQNYWQKLEQRLYNLRHNLSIDGQPLHLPIYATPADPKALLSATVASSQGGAALSQPFMSLWRFPQMLENARSMVNQLTQFGSTLQNIIERQDAEALNALLQNQAAELILTNMSIQNKTIEELDAEKTVLEKSKTGAQSRFDSYSKLYDENINAGENQVMTLHASVAGISTSLKASRLAGAALDLAPNLFGLADGGCHWGAIAKATGDVMEFSASVMNTEADKISQSEAYRRRRQEWEIQRNNAKTELKQIDAQLSSLAIRREAAVLQKTSLKTQQEQTHAQLVFLQRKFSNQTLYNWLRGRLAAIYFQFYDLAISRCLMAEMAYRWETNNKSTHFIKPGAWQGTHAGLLAGETLMLNLAQMEDAYLRWDKRALEVERTVSLADVYTEPNKDRIDLTAEITNLLEKRKDNLGNDDNSIRFNDNKLIATVNLASLKIHEDYPASVGETRRIKQISVTLPALLGPYQDVQAILSYGGSETGLAESCKSLAVSHGMNDSGQFQLDFNNGKFLPFEGIAINDTGTLTLSFPNADKQKTMLQTLSDIILHIRYTIR